MIPLTQQISTCLVALVLALSGASKLVSIRRFREGLLFIPYMKSTWSYIVAFVLPPLELFLALALLKNETLAKCGSILLFLTFISVALLVLSRRLKVPCNCFGTNGSTLISVETVKHDLLLILLIVWSLSFHGRLDLGNTVILASCILLITLSVKKAHENTKALSELRGHGII